MHPLALLRFPAMGVLLVGPSILLLDNLGAYGAEMVSKSDLGAALTICACAGVYVGASFANYRR